MEASAQLPTLIEDYEANIDELEEALGPLLKTPLPETASSLPLLDRSRLYVQAAYAIESTLFSTLQASGVNVREHPIFAELARLKTYFKKIEDVEKGPEKEQQRPRLDKAAAARFIKHGLSGNPKVQSTKFDDAEETRKMESLPKPPKPSAADLEASDSSDEGEHNVDSENAEMYGDDAQTDQPPKSSAKMSKSSAVPLRSKSNHDPTKSKAERKAERRQRKLQRRAARADVADDREPETILPNKDSRQRAPRSTNETFKALLDGSLKKHDRKGKGKGK